MRAQIFTLTRRNALAFAIAGVLAFAAITLVLDLPDRLRRGERGQAAIAMLDAMRRPFLQMKDEEARLLQTLDADIGRRRLEIAVDSASSLLGRYQALARYNPTLSENVAALSSIWKDWIVEERRLFDCVAGSAPKAMGGASATSLVCDLTQAATRFLDTMNTLGAGETAIHADITDGRRAFRLLQACAAVLLLHLIGLTFWSQRTSAKRETALLQDRLREQEKARTLEQALSEALTKALSGFITLCANCKRVRGENDDWTPIDAYVTAKTKALLSHGMCPECMERLYAEWL